MSEKRFKTTTSKKTFVSDTAGPDYLKENNGIFYAKENKYDDFYILCATCHRAIHKLEHPDDLEGLKEIVSSKKKRSWWD